MRRQKAGQPKKENYNGVFLLFFGVSVEVSATSATSAAELESPRQHAWVRAPEHRLKLHFETEKLPRVVG